MHLIIFFAMIANGAVWLGTVARLGMNDRLMCSGRLNVFLYIFLYLPHTVK